MRNFANFKKNRRAQKVTLNAGAGTCYNVSKLLKITIRYKCCLSALLAEQNLHHEMKLKHFITIPAQTMLAKQIDIKFARILQHYLHTAHV